MKFKAIIPVLAATFALTGVSMAGAEDQKKKNKNRPHHSQQVQKPNAAYSVGAGVATAGRRGAEAGALMTSGTVVRDRCAPGANTATTVGAGATYADRKSASASLSTGGTASGTGSVAAGSDVDVGAYRDKTSSDAYATGGSAARADESTRPLPTNC